MISVRAPVRFVLSHYLCTRPLCLPGVQSAVEWIFANNVFNPIVHLVAKLSRYFQGTERTARAVSKPLTYLQMNSSYLCTRPSCLPGALSAAEWFVDCPTLHA